MNGGGVDDYVEVLGECSKGNDGDRWRDRDPFSGGNRERTAGGATANASNGHSLAGVLVTEFILEFDVAQIGQ